MIPAKHFPANSRPRWNARTPASWRSPRAWRSMEKRCGSTMVPRFGFSPACRRGEPESAGRVDGGTIRAERFPRLGTPPIRLPVDGQTPPESAPPCISSLWRVASPGALLFTKRRWRRLLSSFCNPRRVATILG